MTIKDRNLGFKDLSKSLIDRFSRLAELEVRLSKGSGLLAKATGVERILIEENVTKVLLTCLEYCNNRFYRNFRLILIEETDDNKEICPTCCRDLTKTKVTS